VFALFERRAVRAGEVVIRQGEDGDHFFVVESGQFDVYVQPAGSVQPAEHVHTYGSQPGLAVSFGELALLYSKQRAAMVAARTDGVLWSLRRAPFRLALQGFEAAGIRCGLSEPEIRAVAQVLRSVKVLQCLGAGQLHRMAAAMRQVTYHDGDVIITQGDEGSEFYLMQAGQVMCTVRRDPADRSEAPKEVLRLSAGQYFGERALLADARRAANVVAVGTVALLCMGRGAFEAALGGTLQDMMDAEATWKDELAMQKEVLAHKTPAHVGQVGHGRWPVVDRPSDQELCEWFLVNTHPITSACIVALCS
jgi:CRP-like cAMP-binding protein